MAFQLQLSHSILSCLKRSVVKNNRQPLRGLGILRQLMHHDRQLSTLRVPFLRPTRTTISVREYRCIVNSLLTESQKQLSLLGPIMSRMDKRGMAAGYTPDGRKDEDNNKKKPEDDDDKEDSASQLQKALRYFITSYIIISIIALLLPDPNVERFRPISWSEFINQMLSKGEVQQIIVHPEINRVTIHLHEGAVINGWPTPSLVYQLTVPDVSNFEVRLREAEKSIGIRNEEGVPVIYERNDSAWLILFSLIAVGIITLMMSKGKNGSGMKISFKSDLFPMTKAKFTMVDSSLGQGKGVRFNDVAGLKEAKVEIMEFVDYLKKPSRYKELGAKIPKGVLLLGPPGCGKTLLAKAVATEASVPFLAMAGSEFVEMIGGLGAARVRDLFKQARKRSPCIIYIDEIDAIGRARSENIAASMSGGEEEQTLNQLLVEMDGMAGREGIILLASTNRAEVLDKALLRPGRFDRHILIDFPTLKEREEIFAYHLKKIKLEHDPEYYATRMAQLTPGFSGADIANVCNEGALYAAKNKAAFVTRQDLEYSVERVVGGTEKKSRVITPSERKVIAYHESGHALVGWLLKYTDALLKVTIVPRTSAVLGFAMNLPSDQKLYNQEELFDKMCMALGGRVAESLTFNRVSTGAQNDLQKVTEMAYAQVRTYGMDSVVGNLSFPSGEELGGGRRPYSKKLASTIDHRSRLLVARAYKKTEKVLMENKDKLKLLAETLLEKETLNYQDVVDLIGPPLHGAKKTVDLLDFGPNQAAETPTQPPKDPQSTPPASPEKSSTPNSDVQSVSK